MELLYVFVYYKEKAAILVIESEFHITNQRTIILVWLKKNLLNLYLVHLFGFCLSVPLFPLSVSDDGLAVVIDHTAKMRVCVSVFVPVAVSVCV